MQCAQCHDHPDIDDYLHHHYHGLSVFVAGSKLFRQPDGTMVLQEMVTREVEFASVFEPETTKKTGPRLLDVLMDVPELVEGRGVRREAVEERAGRAEVQPAETAGRKAAQQRDARSSPATWRTVCGPG